MSGARPSAAWGIPSVGGAEPEDLVPDSAPGKVNGTGPEERPRIRHASGKRLRRTREEPAVSSGALAMPAQPGTGAGDPPVPSSAAPPFTPGASPPAAAARLPVPSPAEPAAPDPAPGRGRRIRALVAPSGLQVPAMPRRAGRGSQDAVQAGEDGAVPPPRRRPRPRPGPEAKSGIAAQAVSGNLVLTRDTVTAWYVLPGESWSFRLPADKTRAITAQAARLTQLTRRRVHIRVTSRPFPVREWAAALDESVRGRHQVMPGPCPRHPHRSREGCPDCVPGAAWLDWLRDQQFAVRAWGLDDKVVYLGVELGPRGGPGSWLARLSGRDAARAAGLDEVTAAVAGAGLRGTPASPDEMRWLLARSCMLHLPAPPPVAESPAPVPYALPPGAPAEMDAAAIAAFTEAVTMTKPPFARTVTVTRGDGLTRHVAVLTLGSGWAGEEMPWSSPWLQCTDLLPFGCELSVTVDVRDREQVADEMHRLVKEISSQADHYAEHRMSPPPGMSRQFDAARRLEDEQQHGPGALASRATVWVRIAVAGETEEEALARAGQVAEAYSPQIPVVHPPDQLRLAAEFIPGEPLANVAHCRRMPVTLLAAGMVNATSRIGRRDGFPVGRTVSTAARVVTFHPWLDMEEHDRSGLMVVTGTLGSGKTTFGGLMAYMAVRAGIPVVILDPSGLLDRLCTVPEIASHATAVNLLHAPDGSLCPYSLIADPPRSDFEPGGPAAEAGDASPEGRWRQACAAAAARRREIAIEVLRMLLPAEMAGREATAALSKAASEVPATQDASPLDLLEALRRIGDDYGVGHNGLWMADQLSQLADHPWGRLFFPPASGGTAAGGGDVTGAGRLLTVMTLRGLTVPDPGLAPERYTAEQRLSVPLMHLAAWLTRRHVLDRPRHVRKLTIMDEAHIITRGAVGQALVNETARDSRKHNHAAIVMSHLPQDLQLGSVDNLIGMALAGRTDGPDEQAATLGFLGLPGGHGFEQALSELSREAPGQFLVRDGHRGTEIIQVDLSGCSAAVREALNSRPDARAASPAGGAP